MLDIERLPLGSVVSTSDGLGLVCVSKGKRRVRGEGSYLTPPYNVCEFDTESLRRQTSTWRRSVGQGAGVLLGADPELFVCAQGKVLPAWTFLPKKQALAVTAPQVFWDGFQAEFTVTPYACIAYVVDGFHSQLSQILYAARKTSPTAQLVPQCVVELSAQEMARASPEQAALGCAPSLNLYGEEAVAVLDARKLLIRFAGCHVHIGVVLSQDDHIPIVRALDALVGVGMTAALAGLEDGRRRAYYGRAGEYRLPSHGIEYRVPSSAVLIHPVLVHLLYELARRAVEIGGMGVPVWDDVSEEQVRDIINNTDYVSARKLVREHASFFREMPLRNVYPLLLHGAVDMLSIDSMEQNWLVGGEWCRHSGTEGTALANTMLRRART